MSKKYERGSEWRKWDLHFHTPSSYDYKDKSITNEDIIRQLKLHNISAVAITDHHTIDVERIKELQDLANGDITIFPGVEFCSELGGSNSIHYIGIFPETSNLKNLWTKLQGKCSLTEEDISDKGGNTKITCNFEETCKIIQELGGIITIHAGNKSNSLESISNKSLNKMQTKTRLLELYVDILEIGKIDDASMYNTHVFPEIKFRLPMIICSDNHDIKNYELKENLWIKADPTFEGLKQILIEPTERVYIGSQPPLFDRIKGNKTKFIKSLKTKPIDQYEGEMGTWFNFDIKFNSELVAIIGNKGGGKSAIADMLALCCNHKNQNDFSFLNNNKFLKNNLAANFKSEINFEYSEPEIKFLNSRYNDEELVKAKYVPQGYFEKICNEVEKSEDFENEIKNVVFRYIDSSDTLGAKNLDELIKLKSESIDIYINNKKNLLYNLITELVTLEKKENPKYKKEIEAIKKERDLERQALSTPEIVPDPSSSPEISNKSKETLNQLAVCIDQITKFEKNIELFKQEKEIINKNIVYINQLASNIENISTYIEKLQSEHDISKFNVNWSDIITFHYDQKPFNNLISTYNNRIKEIDFHLGLQNNVNNADALFVKLNSERERRQALELNLSGPYQKFALYQNELKNYQDQLYRIQGSEDDPAIHTYKWCEKEISYIDNKLEKDIVNKFDEIIEITKSIFQFKEDILSIYKNVKRNIDSKINDNNDILDNINIEVKAAFSINSFFLDKSLSYINKRHKGSFSGQQEGYIYLKEILNRFSAQDCDDVILFLKEFRDSLKFDKRTHQRSTARYIDDQIFNLSEFYNYLFSLDYLDIIYELEQNGKGLNSLSPGEKGAMLLVFYLLLDMDDRPLILDQPEDNLDNASVANFLVKFIRKAKQRRQIIIVTHNPNLAIVADAEQIIYTNIDKKNNYCFTFESGAIENPLINRHIVDILEGAMPAFRKRDDKYLK